MPGGRLARPGAVAAVALGHARFVGLVFADQAFHALQPGGCSHGLARRLVAKQGHGLVGPAGAVLVHELLDHSGHLFGWKVQRMSHVVWRGQ